MKAKVVFLSGSLQLSGSTTWINALIKGFEQQNIPCLHLITGVQGAIKSNAKHVYYTGRARHQWLLRIMRWIQIHKLCKNFYKKQEALFFLQKSEYLLTDKLTDKVLVIKDFTSFLPDYFKREQFVVVAVLHQQYKKFVQGYFYHILCSVSETVRQESCRLGFNAQHVIYNPLDVEQIRCQALEYQVHESQDFLLFIGKLHKEKGVFELLEAYRELVSEKQIKLNLIYVGEGKEKKLLLQKITEYGLQKQVKLTGFLLNPYPYIKQAKLLILPSYSEAMPYVAIEAAVLNTPYLVSDFSSAREFFHEENIFPMQNKLPNIPAMKEMISRLISQSAQELNPELIEKIQPEAVVASYYNLLKEEKS